jgi:hypothetical protein
MSTTRTANATYTPIHTQDPEELIHKHSVPWHKNPSKKRQAYLVERKKSTAHDLKEKMQSFAQLEKPRLACLASLRD